MGLEFNYSVIKPLEISVSGSSLSRNSLIMKSSDEWYDLKISLKAKELKKIFLLPRAR